MSLDTFYMQIICFGVLLLAANFGGKLSRYLRIGEVVGQVIGGLLIGPVLLFFVGHHIPAYKEAIIDDKANIKNRSIKIMLQVVRNVFKGANSYIIFNFFKII